jgi:hypothetical protein
MRLLLTELDTLDELRIDELLNATLEELRIITTTELCELDSKLLLELLDELLEESIEEIAAELLDEELLVTEELLITLDETWDDCNELLLTITPMLLDELEVASSPPQPVNNISTTDNRTTLIFSK